MIRYPINNAFPDTELTPAEAKRRLGLREDERAILFLGRIVPYKGIEYLLDAFRLLLAHQEAKYRLIIAGEPKKGSEECLNGSTDPYQEHFIEHRSSYGCNSFRTTKWRCTSKAADVIALPYKEIFQSGVLFLAYTFGLPVVATDVGIFSRGDYRGQHGISVQARRSRRIGQSYRDLLQKRPLQEFERAATGIEELR